MKARVIDLGMVVRMDDKCRFIIPADLRRYLRIAPGSELGLMYDANKKRVILQAGYNPELYVNVNEYYDEVYDDVIQKNSRDAKELLNEIHSENNTDLLINLKKLKANLNKEKEEKEEK